MSFTAQNQSNVNRLVYENFGSGFQSYQVVGTEFFNRVEPERFDEKFAVSAAGNSIAAVAEGAPYPSQNVVELGNVEISQQAYKGEIPVNFLMKRFDNYGVVLREAKKQGYRAKQVMDQVMADVLLNVEGTTTIWSGDTLANATHQIGNTGSTQSNITTGALSESVLNSADVALMTQQDHAGQVMPVVGRYLVHPYALRMTAHKLVNSTEGPETADRETGYINTLGIMPRAWSLLDNGGNTTDCHLIADKLYNYLQYLVSVEPTIYLREDSDTGNDLYQIEFACAAGAVDYLGYQFINAA